MNFAEIIDDASDAVRASVQAAYDAGKAAGREEAMAELQLRLSDFFGADAIREPVRREVTINEAVALTSDASARAAPGSVKPVVERMLKDAKSGLTASEIADRAGFKFNSVRGTLWALGKEGFAISQGGRWFAIANKPDGAIVTTEEQIIDDEDEAMNAAVDQSASRGGYPDLR